MKKSLLVKIGIGAAAVVALVFVGLVALIAFFPKDVAVREIERQVEASTERKLDIAGDFSFSIWPALGFSAGDVTLSQPAGFEGEPFLKADRVVFAVALMPLFSGDIQVRKLYLDAPQLNLIGRADGSGNWEFPTAEPKPGEEQQELKALRLEDVRVTDGRLIFQGAEGAPLVAEDIDASLSLDSLDEPAKANGSLRYLNQPLRFEAVIGAPRAVLTQEKTPLTVSVDNDLVNLDFDGEADTTTGNLSGTAEAQGDSVRRLLAWLGSPLPPGDGFERYSGRAHFLRDAQAMRLTRGTFALDEITATGDLTILTASNGRMTINGALASPRVDVNPYLPPPPQAPASAEAGDAAAVNVETAWANDPIDLSGLRAMDANLNISIGELLFQKMKFQNARLALRLNGGVADARLTQIQLYGGAGTARLVADARQSATRIAAELDVNNIQAEPLLTDAIGFDRIQGRGRLVASVVGQGSSQAALMRTLRGNAAFNFNNGAYKGVNLAQIGRQVQALREGNMLAASSAGAGAETDFSAFTSSFTIADGVAVTQDIQMLSPYIRLSGGGLINIGEQSLDMRLVPRAVGSGAGQGGSSSVDGYGVPFRARGPWSRISFAPDLEDAMRSLVQEQARRALERSDLGDLGILFGLGRTPAATETPTDAPIAEAPAGDVPPTAPSDGTTPPDTPAPTPTPQEEKSDEQRALEALGGLFKQRGN
ncbi:MAG: AsmA family protein [Caulobacterales bacterium]